MRAKYLLNCLISFLYFLPVNRLFSQSQQDRKTAITNFFEQQASVKYFYQAALDVNAERVAWCADGPEGLPVIQIAFLKDTSRRIILQDTTGTPFNATEPAWSPDGQTLAFLMEADSTGHAQVFLANPSTGRLINTKALTNFDGHIDHLKWSPDGRFISVLYVAKASRNPSPMAAQNRAVGLIDSAINRNVQRVAIIDLKQGDYHEITPPGLYIFEYDWSPDSRQLAYTAALPPGDDNWYIARLFKQSVQTADTVSLYQPTFQIALPRWSTDGKKIGFIEGLMSDQGGTGGEIKYISSDGGPVVNLTQNRPSSPSWFAWQPDGNMLFSEFKGGSVAINALNVINNKETSLWKADESIRGGLEEMSLSIAWKKNKPVFAFQRSGWNRLPELWCGSTDKLQQVTTANNNQPRQTLRTANITWQSDGNAVQGWLIYPKGYDSTKQYPLLVFVHGGPAWISLPTWSLADFNATVYPQLGYFLFLPNPRGSHGQGQRFTLANRKDWGFGDLRDILSGVDAVLKQTSVDSTRMGIFGWSYGGSMSMIAGTQTNRFRAAVAGAGAADWVSYYGQNGIDQWMRSYFGKTPYDDPSAYAKVSAMTYIKQHKTPTLILAGELDAEAPPAQSIQFWHALKELGVPTQLMIYEGEGHSFEKFDHMIDASVRTIEWFDKYLK